MITKLLIASGKRAGRAISMKRDKLLIGRAEECDLRPLSEEVSRKHCAIIKKDDVLWAKDLRSRNGTFVNGLRLSEPKQLADGDLVRVGSLELKVSVAVEPKLETEEDISRLLLGGDDPAGIHDTTRSIDASGDDSALVHGSSEPKGKDAAEATMISSAGVVDEDYRGNVGVVMFNHSEVEVNIKVGDRIAQLVCEKISYPEIQELETLDDTERARVDLVLLAPTKLL